MRAKQDIKTEENRLNDNLKKLGQDKRWIYKMFQYGKHTWAIGFYKINH